MEVAAGVLVAGAVGDVDEVPVGHRVVGALVVEDAGVAADEVLAEEVLLAKARPVLPAGGLIEARAAAFEEDHELVADASALPTVAVVLAALRAARALEAQPDARGGAVAAGHPFEGDPGE